MKALQVVISGCQAQLLGIIGLFLERKAVASKVRKGRGRGKLDGLLSKERLRQKAPHRMREVVLTMQTEKSWK
jgi:hypothetical protein